MFIASRDRALCSLAISERLHGPQERAASARAMQSDRGRKPRQAGGSPAPITRAQVAPQEK